MEKVGQVNGYVCKCGWSTLTINLNNGTTPMFIACRGDQKQNPNLPLIGEHRAESNMYCPQQWWFERLSMQIERAWIRPSANYLQKFSEDNEILGLMLDYHMNGGLLLVDLNSDYSAAPVFPNYGKSVKDTNDYLESVYSRLLKKVKK